MSLRERLERGLSGRLAPILAGVITALLVTYVWGGLDIPGAYHDERAYVVQARLLAHFTWSVPAPPLPLFWEMPHVFVEPRIFARYPPGHSLMLVPGIWLGLPGLMPVLLSGGFASMLFIIARAIAGPLVALGTWALWTTSTKALDWHSSYFSENTSGFFWLLALWLLLRWVKDERPWQLPSLVAAMAFVGITRPVTGLALLAPITVVVLVVSMRRRSVRGWGVSAVVGALVCSLVPLWTLSTSGSLRSLPYAEYSRWYFPFDMPGFTRDSSPPLRELPPDFEALATATRRQYDGHVPAAVPGYVTSRSWDIVRSSLGDDAAALVALVPLGMLAVGGAVSAVAVSSFLLMVAAYVLMPHSLGWSIYYVEIFPLVPFLSVAGLFWLAARYRESRAAAVILTALVLLNARDIPAARQHEAIRGARQRLAQAMLSELEDPRAVVFVRRTGPMSPHFTLWDILGDPRSTPTWVVRDLGDARNAELVARAEERRAYLLDEAKMTLTPYTPMSTYQAIP